MHDFNWHFRLMVSLLDKIVINKPFEGSAALVIDFLLDENLKSD